MAERRMFCKSITESDAFLDLPHSTQNLYFHLGLAADDDGFVNCPKKVQRTAGCADEDMRTLIEKRFLIAFPSGLVVIKHWKMNNYIRPDRYTQTAYQDEFAALSMKENGTYTLVGEQDADPDTDGIPDGYQPYTGCLPSIGKDRLGEDREEAPPAAPETPAPKAKPAPPKGIVPASKIAPPGSWLGTPLREAIEKTFDSQNEGPDGKPRYGNYPKEAKALNGICSMVHNLAGAGNEMAVAKAVLEEFLKLTESGDRFWTSQPFTPSGLSPLFDRVVAAARKRRGTGPPKGEGLAERYEKRKAEQGGENAS